MKLLICFYYKQMYLWVITYLKRNFLQCALLKSSLGNCVYSRVNLRIEKNEICVQPTISVTFLKNTLKKSVPLSDTTETSMPKRHIAV